MKSVKEEILQKIQRKCWDIVSNKTLWNSVWGQVCTPLRQQIAEARYQIMFGEPYEKR